MTTNDAFASLRIHAMHSRQYLENAYATLREGEAGKAGELLWGSVAQAVHAVAVSRGIAVKTHRELKNFVMQVANDLNDETIITNFNHAESLHHNFYEVKQEPRDIALLIPAVQDILEKLFSLIPSELLELRTTL